MKQKRDCRLLSSVEARDNTGNICLGNIELQIRETFIAVMQSSPSVIVTDTLFPETVSLEKLLFV